MKKARTFETPLGLVDIAYDHDEDRDLYAVEFSGELLRSLDSDVLTDCLRRLAS